MIPIEVVKIETPEKQVETEAIAADSERVLLEEVEPVKAETPKKEKRAPPTPVKAPEPEVMQTVVSQLSRDEIKEQVLRSSNQYWYERQASVQSMLQITTPKKKLAWEIDLLGR